MSQKKGKRRVTARDILFPLLSAFLAWADLHVKGISATMAGQMEGKVLIPGILSFSYTENQGMAFGMSQGQSRVLFFVGILALGGFLFLYIHERAGESHLAWPGLCLASGGTVGNMVSRIRDGYVVDFLKFDLIRFPVFNLADVFLVTGLLLVMLWLLLQKEEDLDKRGG